MDLLVEVKPKEEDKLLCYADLFRIFALIRKHVELRSAKKIQKLKFARRRALNEPQLNNYRSIVYEMVKIEVNIHEEVME